MEPSSGHPGLGLMDEEEKQRGGGREILLKKGRNGQGALYLEETTSGHWQPNRLGRNGQPTQSEWV